MTPEEQVAEMKKELLNLMLMESRGSWGPTPLVCRWCECWLRYTDKSTGKPYENHAKDCFAVKMLGRPTHR